MISCGRVGSTRSPASATGSSCRGDVTRRIRWPPVRASLLWGAIFVALTAVMRAARSDIGEPHVALVYLLLVLGGSVAGGRALGFALAGAGFLAIDYFFQFPYDQFSVGKPLDWTALVAFLATSAVTSELVTRALSEAEAARRRADEVARLSRLGSRALHAGRARDARRARLRDLPFRERRRARRVGRARS